MDDIALIATVMVIMTNLAPIQEEGSFVSCAVKRAIYISNAQKNIVYAVVQKVNPIGWYILRVTNVIWNYDQNSRNHLLLLDSKMLLTCLLLTDVIILCKRRKGASINDVGHFFGFYDPL